MAEKSKTELANLIALVVCILVIVFAVSWSSLGEGSLSGPLRYVNLDNKLAFNYPANVTVVDELKSGDLSVINLYTKGKENISDEIISITSMQVDSVKSVVETAADYLEVDRDKIDEIDREDVIEARYVSYNVSGEVRYYNFFQEGSRLDIVKFNQKVFDRGNPLIIRNNSYYNFAYVTILNSLDFAPEY